MDSRREIRAGRLRTTAALAAAALLHLGLLAAGIRAASPRRAGAQPGVVELQIAESRGGPNPLPAAIETGRDGAGPSAAATRRHRARVAPADAVKSLVPAFPDVSAGAPSALALDAGVGSPPRPDGAKLALDWSGFERVFGDEASADREAYAAERRQRRERALGFGRWNRLVLRALGDNRRFGPRGAPLSSTEARDAVSRYLAILDSRITPPFNEFLLSVGSPNDRMHGGIQRSLLRYNPFYVAPPPGEAADKSSALAAVARPARAEFSLEASGALDEIRLTATSGSGPFDASAIAAVCAGSPFPPPPALLLSHGDRAFFAWGFDKDWHKNGRANAQHLVVEARDTLEGAAPLEPGL
jgi:hypothetical protein